MKERQREELKKRRELEEKREEMMQIARLAEVISSNSFQLFLIRFCKLFLLWSSQLFKLFQLSKLFHFLRRHFKKCPRDVGTTSPSFGEEFPWSKGSVLLPFWTDNTKEWNPWRGAFFDHRINEFRVFIESYKIFPCVLLNRT